MRKLKTTDIFEAMRVIRKANIKEELTPFVKEAAQSDKPIEDIGVLGFLTLFEILSSKGAEQGIYDFLSKPFEMTPKEVADLEIADLVKLLNEMKELNDLSVFFGSLSGLMNSK